MSTVLLAVIALVLIVGLIATVMTAKQWHWAQMLLLLGILLASAGAMLLSAETLRIHRALRSKLPGLQARLAEVQTYNDALRTGTSDPALISKLFRNAEQESPFNADTESIPGLPELTQRVKYLVRQRGRLWKDVRPAPGQQPGTIQATIPQPAPHGMPQGAIVFAFEAETPGGNAGKRPEFMGQFVVINSEGQTVTLAPIHLLNQRMGARLTASRGPWRVYETMPTDRHDLYAQLTDQQLQKLLPQETVEEYIRHGQPSNPDDDPEELAGYDEDGQRVSPDVLAKASRGDYDTRYDRKLRSYGFIFEDILRRRVEMQSRGLGLQQDIAKLKAANQRAEKLSSYREEEKRQLDTDKELMIRDRQAITKLAEELSGMIKQAEEYLDAALLANKQLSQQIMQRAPGRIEVNAGF